MLGSEFIDQLSDSQLLSENSLFRFGYLLFFLRYCLCCDTWISRREI